MTLIKCKECGSEISDKAIACPKCGAPVARKSASKPANASARALWIVMAAAAFGVGVVWLGADDKNAAPRTAPKAERQCETDDLQCRGDKGVVAAGIYCKDAIERSAKHSVRWVDGSFETKMSRFRWTAKPAGTITYVGDKAEFQNGFGAYTRVIYECDLNDDLKTVLNVRVREGRLPAN